MATVEEGVVAPTGRVLLVGKRARVLDRLADALRREGLHVRQETEDRAGSLVGGDTVDVVALGRAVTGNRRDTIVRELRARNPSLRVVDGLAPITPLLVAQIQEALTVPSREPPIIISAGVDPSDRSVLLRLRRQANVTVDLYRLDLLYRAHEEHVHSGPLNRGSHVLPTKGRVTAGERFVVVRADDQTTVHPVA
ncbi:MAG TPA: hypothetical protein VHI11_11265 [Jiangellaceae bacterium]|jgi:hypothetical protein|nr:hypothetical protein [Jiangellaceae bacterium]